MAALSRPGHQPGMRESSRYPLECTAPSDSHIFRESESHHLDATVKDRGDLESGEQSEECQPEEQDKSSGEKKPEAQQQGGKERKEKSEWWILATWHSP